LTKNKKSYRQRRERKWQDSRLKRTLLYRLLRPRVNKRLSLMRLRLLQLTLLTSQRLRLRSWRLTRTNK
jgi:hypothetical protein